MITIDLYYLPNFHGFLSKNVFRIIPIEFSGSLSKKVKIYFELFRLNFSGFPSEKFKIYFELI